MFQTLDVMISLGVVFLILSMVHKYAMSIIKRAAKIKAKIIREEMESFVGKNTSQYLVPYLDKKAHYLNFLDDIKKGKGTKKATKGLRRLDKEQLKDIVTDLKTFLENKSVKQIKEALNLEISEDAISNKLDEIKTHLDTLKARIEHAYDNTMNKIGELYENKLRKLTLISGLVLVVLINADFFEVHSTLAKQSLVREKLVAQAELINTQASKMTTQLEGKTEKEIVKVKQEIQRAKEDIAELTNKLERAGLQLGWTREKLGHLFALREEKPLTIFLRVLTKLLGFSISALLISFGAPFWHDFLSLFGGINRKLQETREREKAASKD
jgi:hypothetical protein